MTDTQPEDDQPSHPPYEDLSAVRQDGTRFVLYPDLDPRNANWLRILDGVVSPEDGITPTGNPPPNAPPDQDWPTAPALPLTPAPTTDNDRPAPGPDASDENDRRAPGPDASG